MLQICWIFCILNFKADFKISNVFKAVFLWAQRDPKEEFDAKNADQKS